jgi:hypothetical protein
LSISEEALERIVSLPISFFNIQNNRDKNQENEKDKSKVARKKGMKNLTTRDDDDGDDAFDLGFDLSDDDDLFGEEEDGVEVEAEKKTAKAPQHHALDATAKLVYNFIGRNSLIVLASYLTVLEKVVSRYRQNDKFCLIVYEMCFSVLRLDGPSNPMTEIIDPTGSAGHLLVPVQKEAVNVLRAIFRLYPLHRASLLQELYPIFAQVYSVKSGD